MKPSIKRFIKNDSLQHFTIYGFGQFFNLVTPLLVAPYLIRLCGEANFGKTAVGLSLAFFLIVFVDYGSDIVGLRRVSIARNEPAQLPGIFYTGFAVKAVMLLAMLVLATLLFLTVPYFKAEQPLFFLSLTVLVGQFLSPTWFLQGLENVRWITYLNIAAKSIYLLGVFAFVQSTSDYIFVNLWWGLGMIIANGFTVFRIIQHYQLGPVKWNSTTVIDQLKTDFALFSSQIFVSLQLYAPIMLVSFIGNHTLAGHYRIIEQVIVMFKTYIFLFFNYLFSRICFLLHEDPAQGLRTWKLFNGANFLFISGCMLLVSYFAEEVVAYFNPAAIDELSSILRIACWYPVLLAISIPLKQLVLGWNFNRFYVRLTSSSVIFNLLAIVFVLPIWGIKGVFVTLLITEALVGIFYLSCIRKKI